MNHHVFKKIRPFGTETLNRCVLEKLDIKLRSSGTWAQVVNVDIELNGYCSEETKCYVRTIRTEIKSEPLSVEFVGLAPFIDAFSKDQVNAPVLATHRSKGGSPPYPFGVGVIGKLARKFGMNWGTEYLLSDVASAIFDGSLLVFTRSFCYATESSCDYRGYEKGLLIQSPYERLTLEKYNIR